jgi:hypothetical protein
MHMRPELKNGHLFNASPVSVLRYPVLMYVKFHVVKFMCVYFNE